MAKERKLVGIALIGTGAILMAFSILGGCVSAGRLQEAKEDAYEAGKAQAQIDCLRGIAGKKAEEVLSPGKLRDALRSK